LPGYKKCTQIFVSETSLEEDLFGRSRLRWEIEISSEDVNRMELSEQGPMIDTILT
jgi:hypothetical protein